MVEKSKEPKVISSNVVRNSVTKSEIVNTIARKQRHLAHKDVELAVKALLEQMSQSLSNGERIEIRGFGSFSLHYRAPRVGRNPRTGESVNLSGKYIPHFKPGKELRDRVNHFSSQVAKRPAASKGGKAASSPPPTQNNLSSPARKGGKGAAALPNK